MKKTVLLTIILCIFLQLFLGASEIRLSAEWEPTRGTLIRWPLGIPLDLVQELAANDMLYVLVENTNQQNSAENIFSANNINLDNCEFIFAPTNSHWTRDWGPHNIFDADDNWAIVDPLFDGYPWVSGDRDLRDYDDDDAVNAILADYFGTYNSALPVYLTGGNLLTDGLGRAFSTIQMYNESSHLYSQREFLDIVEDFTGVNDFHFLPNIEDYGIQHIDCGAKLLDPETVLIKELPEGHPEYQRMEAVADYFRSITNSYGRNYNIHRIFCDTYSGNEAAAYTNSYILNKKVLVPLFGITADADAIEKYQQLMPGYEIIGFYYDNWYYYDALHCRTREIMDAEMLYLQHRPLDSEQPANTSITIEIFLKAYSNTVIHNAILAWRYSGEQDWETINLQHLGENLYQVEFPLFELGSEIEYYISANDETGRVVYNPIAAPVAFHSFSITNSASANSNQLQQDTTISISPNPFSFRNNNQIRFSLPSNITNGKIEIFNIKGQKIVSLGMQAGSHNQIFWNGLDKQNKLVGSGIYFVHLKQEDNVVQRGKMVVVK